MIYKPQIGQIKDDTIFYHNGKFYLFSMYHKENCDKFNNIWLAISEDGVNFKDYGCIVEDFPRPIWAMYVYKVDDGFMMNSGSFGDDGSQSVLQFWYSKDLINWEFMPELDVASPVIEGKNMRLDCMYVINENGKYYGYATGQFGFLTSDDGKHWHPHKTNINYFPFPEYNPALGGFEIADCKKIEDKYYMFCGGFGHLGNNGYGVYIYESNTPDGTFKPHLPNYRINGTSKRWVNMWERFFEKDGEILTCNYMYDGFSYENGNVWLPPIKKLCKNPMGLYLEWWQGNEKLIGNLWGEYEKLSADNGNFGVFDDNNINVKISDTIAIKNPSVVEFSIRLQENKFTEYSSGGFYLKEDESHGTAVIFDTYGKCTISAIEGEKISVTDDIIGFGSTAPYYFESGKTYNIRLLVRNNMFEIYVNDKYLQTFNTAHFKNKSALDIIGFGAISNRRECQIENIKIFEMNI